MDWSFFDEMDKFFEDLGNITAFISACFDVLPSIFKFVLGFVLVFVIIAGGLYMVFKLIG